MDTLGHKEADLCGRFSPQSMWERKAGWILLPKPSDGVGFSWWLLELVSENLSRH